MLLETLPGLAFGEPVDEVGLVRPGDVTTGGGQCVAQGEDDFDDLDDEDFDDDNLPNGIELYVTSTNPLNAYTYGVLRDDNYDSDSDFLPNWFEVYRSQTDPLYNDTNDNGDFDCFNGKDQHKHTLSPTRVKLYDDQINSGDSDYGIAFRMFPSLWLLPGAVHGSARASDQRNDGLVGACRHFL